MDMSGEVVKYPHEDWRKEPGNNSKNDLLTWTERDNSHNFYVAKGGLFREYPMILLTFQPKIVWQIAFRRHQRRQTTWSQRWKQGDGQMLTFMTILEHAWNIRPSCLRGAEHSCTQGRRMFSLPECFEDFSRTKLHKKDHFEWCLWGPIILKNKGNKRCAIGITCRWALLGQQNLRRSVVAQTKTFEHEGQNASKITFVFTDSCIQTPWPVMSILMRILCLCLALMNILLSVVPPSSNFATMGVMKPRRVETEDNY